MKAKRFVDAIDICHHVSFSSLFLDFDNHNMIVTVIFGHILEVFSIIIITVIYCLNKKKLHCLINGCIIQKKHFSGKLSHALKQVAYINFQRHRLIQVVIKL